LKGNNELIKDRFIVILHKLASGDTLHVGKKTLKYNVKWTVSHKERTKFCLSSKEYTCESKQGIFNSACMFIW